MRGSKHVREYRVPPVQRAPGLVGPSVQVQEHAMRRELTPERRLRLIGITE
jgi:hypothetical protein